MAFGPFTEWSQSVPTGSTEVRSADNVIRANWRDLQKFMQNVTPEFPATTRFIGPSASATLDLGSAGSAYRFNNLFMKGQAQIPSAAITTLRSNSALITTIRALTKVTGPLVSSKSGKFATARANNAVITTARFGTKATGPLLSGTNLRFLKATGGLLSSKSGKLATGRANLALITTLRIGTKASGPLFSGTNMRFTKATGGTITATNGRIGTLRLNTKATGPLMSATNMRVGLITGKSTLFQTARATRVLGKTLGAWDSGKAVNTVYQAASDGFVIMQWANQADCDGEILSDGSNPPTTVRATVDTGAGTGIYETLMAPVRSGDYWKAQQDAGTATVLWIPLGAA